MARARISKDGIMLAEPGYNVDTAPLTKMVLSPNFPTMRIVYTGYGTVQPYSGLDGADAHDRFVFTFPTPFVSPPIVLVSGVINSSTSDQAPFVYQYEADSGALYVDTHYSLAITPHDFVLYVMKSNLPLRGEIPRTWKYFVFGNTLDP